MATSKGGRFYLCYTRIMQRKAKKSLGQNFLKSAQAIRDIIGAGELSPRDTVLEIGPGKGALTEALLQTGATVVAIEKDRELFAHLSEKFQNEITSKKLMLIEGDALEFSISDLPTTNFKLIANIPYNITGLIFRKFLESGHQPERMVLLVQKEVAERIVARPTSLKLRGIKTKESILSISVKAYGSPKIIAKVPARYFSPAPKVDSAIIAITNISKQNFTKVDENRFFEVVRAGFAHKRKVLIKNLEEGLGVAKEELLIVWKTLGLSLNTRAEELKVTDWLHIVSSIK